MKKLSVIFMLCLSLFMALAFVSCTENTPEPPPTPPATDEVPQLKDITGISFENVSFTYDGTQKEIKINGILPEGVTVSYTNNTATNVGTYDAVATLSGVGYNTLTLNAKLTINAAEIEGVTFDGVSFIYDGTQKEIKINGILPEGVTVSYTNNAATNAGTYDAVATLSGANYKTLTLNAKLTVNKAIITGVSAETEQSVYGDGKFHRLK